MRQKLLAFILFLSLGSGLFSKEVPSSGEMMFDILAIRPLGIASLGLGIALFGVSIPFWFFTPNPPETIRQTGKRLVVYPFSFTFQRPIGDFPGYTEELEFVKE